MSGEPVRGSAGDWFMSPIRRRRFGGQLATLLLCQKLSYLVTPAMRLDDELAAVEGRFRAADFNPCPVAREHDAPRQFHAPSP